MKRGYIFGIIILCLLVVILNFVPASDKLMNDKDHHIIGHLKEGKNEISINQTIYANELFILNPEIEYISYFDDKTNKTIGYLNIFGGIGKNFELAVNKTYEVGSKKDIQLKIWRY